MISTILKNPPEGYENVFAGNFDKLPEDRLEVQPFYDLKLIRPVLVNGEWLESENEIERQQRLKSIEESIKTKYQSMINMLLNPYIQKYIIDNEEIPTNIISERNSLKEECNQLITNLYI